MAILNKFLQLKSDERKDALLAAEVANEYNLPAYIIEKDFWVTETLRILYTEIAPKLKEYCKDPFVFKGGTSLSKCFNIINRMSEDIDLSFSLELLRHDKVTLQEGVGRNKLLNKAKAIDTSAEEYIKENLLEPLSNFLRKLDNRIVIKIENETPLDIGIYYPKELSDDQYGGAVQPRVLLETGGRSDNNPTTEVDISHMLGECINELLDEQFSVISLAPERTMLEKIFGVHTNLTQKKGLPKYARHLYDILQLHNQNVEWYKNKTLFLEHVNFSDANYKTHKESCESARKGPIKITPDCELMSQHYQNDWESMADMFPNAVLPYTYKELIQKISEIENAFNQLNYK